jgi:hypothetical protein
VVGFKTQSRKKKKKRQLRTVETYTFRLVRVFVADADKTPAGARRL